MDKGIENTHGAQITSSSSDIVLAPGKNRLTTEQFAELRKDKVIAEYLKCGLLSVYDIPPPEGDGGGKPAKGKPAEGKPPEGDGGGK